MKFEVMPIDWYKRRDPDKNKPEIKNVEVIGFEKKDGGHCEMVVEYTDGDTLNLNAYISVNDGNQRWTVNGMNQHGVSVLVRLVE